LAEYNVRVGRWIDILHLLPRMCLLRRFRLALQRKIGEKTNGNVVSFLRRPINMEWFRTSDIPVEIALCDCLDKPIAKQQARFLAAAQNGSRAQGGQD